MQLVSIWRTSGKFRLGAVMLAILVLAAVFNRQIIELLLGEGANPQEVGGVGSGALFEDPSREHWLGTDRFGRDWLGMILQSLPITLQVSTLAALVTVATGAIVGFTAGFVGGRTDTVLRSIMDLLLVVPTFPLILVLASFARGMNAIELALVLSIFAWAGTGRVIRTQVLSLRERPYIELSRMTNMSNREIITKDMMPNMLPYLGIQFAERSIDAAFALVGLTVIGLAPNGLLDLGALINLSLSWAVLSLGKYLIFAAPMVVLTVYFMAFALINNGLEEFYNPRLRR
jgi:peptide/nickel transport system permease protein